MKAAADGTPLTVWKEIGELESSTDLAVARGLVARCSPISDVQATHRFDVLEFIDEHPDAHHRSCLVGHLTGSGWVVDHSGEFGLVLYHSKIQRWVQPGGHADGEANLAIVALTEATEETGIDGLEVWPEPVDVDIHTFVNQKFDEPDHLHLDLRFAMRAPLGARVQGNHESEALRWISEDELDSAELDLDESTRRLARQSFALVRSQRNASER